MATKIRLDITPGGNGSRIYLDDRELRNVRAVKISVGVDEASRVTLELVGLEVEIHGEAAEVITDQTALTDAVHRFGAGA